MSRREARGPRPVARPHFSHPHVPRSHVSRPRVWRAPIGLALLSAVGLVAALLGDGAWDAVSWFGLGAPVAVCLWYGWPRRRR